MEKKNPAYRETTSSTYPYRTKSELMEEVNIIKPPYNRDSKCSKCGHDYASTTYIGGSATNARAGMHRQCGRCQYVWFEMPLDSIV